MYNLSDYGAVFPLLWQYKDEVKTMAQAFFGGVHPNDMKAATNEKAIEQLAPPAQVVIPIFFENDRRFSYFQEDLFECI